MSFLTRVEEKVIKNKSNLIGHREIFDKCKNIIKLVHGTDRSLSLLCEELDIRSINIFYGDTGTGKTTLSYALARYALEEFEIETYELKVQDIIKTELGKTLENFHTTYEEINHLSSNDKGLVLLLDEFDRLLVDRHQTNEVSEMKRAFISLMDFLQSISIDHKITILATTNCFDTLDSALKRRFSFQYEVLCSKEALEEYLQEISCKIPSTMNYTIPAKYIETSKTIAELKQKIRVDVVDFLSGDARL